MEPNLVVAPWTAEQVDWLNKNQKSPYMHPYTCINSHNKEEDRVLVATPDGWVCRQCGYTQNWALGFSTKEMVYFSTEDMKFHGEPGEKV